ncbi:MAG: nucleoside triphosphate pyrophosphohydrolase [Sandaracinus sp.]
MSEGRNFPEQRGQTLPELVELMQRLLAPDGCPWDREQTLETLRTYVIEEAHEVVDAIDRGSPDALREELGDLLLQIVFQSEIGRQKGWFGPDDVVRGIVTKMIARHPHVFGGDKLATADEVLAEWEQRKARERAAQGKGDKGALDGVPVAMPSLLRAVRVGEKASRFGYDWPSTEAVRAKVDEELAELDEATASGDAQRMEEELGDVLFALASWSRRSKIDPEAALRGSLDRFTKRFSSVETYARKTGKDLSAMTAEELDALWQRAKRGELGAGGD